MRDSIGSTSPLAAAIALSVCVCSSQAGAHEDEDYAGLLAKQAAEIADLHEQLEAYRPNSFVTSRPGEHPNSCASEVERKQRIIDLQAEQIAILEAQLEAQGR